ncbi:MAG: class I tRNA ligase family protein [Candidatus Liptonbacteria bacterium]|nr:class I tRNA ligase family protein [Candidatus Liptonbacteria bacterium]
MRDNGIPTGDAPAFSSPGAFHLPKEEEQILKFWKTHRIFEKTIALRQAQGKKHFVFFEGPPTANGRPGIHHVLARSFKDIILRYKTMRGFFVPRRGGWDTHGLPVEIEVEKALGLTSKKDIEKYGIAEFNQKCRESVWKYKDEWEKLTERMGFWLDLKNPYVTYETSYIETLWWTIKEFWKKKLLYEGHKVVPWCTRCGTALSSHELAQGYEEATDQSVYVKFKLRSQSANRKARIAPNTYVLSWTTTPWTLPGNVALAVGRNIRYMSVTVQSIDVPNLPLKEGETYIFAATDDADKRILGVEARHPQGNQSVADIVMAGKVIGKFTNIKDFKGSDLAGLSYEPLFDVKSLRNKNSHKIYAADFVTTDEGTGVVHTAVMYGEDDYQLGVNNDLPQRHTVSEEGKFTKDVLGLSGLAVKDKKTEEKIFSYLKKRDLLFATQPYTHEYPFCWRCGTPLIYYARKSWFVAMSKLRGKLLKENKKINWVPLHLREGRFGEWLRDVKDWNFSRERYWGTPLPIWRCGTCAATEVIGGVEELRTRAGKAKNEYWVLRHGESEIQLLKLIDSGQKQYHLTTIGRDQVKQTAERLKKAGIEVLISSDILRTKETAEIAAGVLGIKKVIFDPRLHEIHLGKLSGCRSEEYGALYPTLEMRFEKRPEGGESLRDLRARAWKLLSELERTHKGKRILLVSHEYPIWMLFHAGEGWDERETILRKGNAGEPGKDFVRVGEARKLELKVLPRNESGLVDLHRPFIDECGFPCGKCRGEMRRVTELADAWFDSGAMPFAQAHWPFAQHPTSHIQRPTLPNEYPADYITEAMDQTRGWFYTLLAVATALGRERPYKNVISLGLLHDMHGKKMSKSKGNVVDPWRMMEKYGVDAVRWYFYTVKPAGEPMNFEEADVLKAYRRFHLLLYNSLVFYKTYGKAFDVGREKLDVRSKTSNIQHPTSNNILDKWILARLEETKKKTTDSLESYDVRGAALALEALVDDLSRWYIRRSRRRFQPERQGAGKNMDKGKDFNDASVTLGHVLHELTLLISPFTPFFAEFLYGELKGNVKTALSPHLADWPILRKGQRANGKALIAAMEEVRRIASVALAKRAEAGIKVRQPLAALRVAANSKWPARLAPASLRVAEGKSGRSQREAGRQMANRKELLEILADEVNVKEIKFDRNTKEDVALDTAITLELKREGMVREMVRMVQDLRQDAGLKPRDKIEIYFALPSHVQSILQGAEQAFLHEVGARTIYYKKTDKFDAELDSKLDGVPIWVAVKKI